MSGCFLLSGPWTGLLAALGRSFPVAKIPGPSPMKDALQTRLSAHMRPQLAFSNRRSSMKATSCCEPHSVFPQDPDRAAVKTCESQGRLCLSVLAVWALCFASVDRRSTSTSSSRLQPTRPCLF